MNCKHPDGYLNFKCQSSSDMLNIEGFQDFPVDWYKKRKECPTSLKDEINCPDSFSNINGECIQVCRGCDYNDKKGYFGNCNPVKEEEIKRINYIFNSDLNGDGTEEEIFLSIL